MRPQAVHLDDRRRDAVHPTLNHTFDHMDLLLMPLAAVAAVALDTLWVALFRAGPMGKFKVVRDGSAIFQFESDSGSFSFLPK